MNTPRRPGPRKVYLVQPKFPPSYWGMEHFLELTEFAAIFPPLGLLTLAALTPPEFEVEVCDQNAGEKVDFDTDAEVVGVTGYILQMDRVFAIADRFRALGKTVVIGGPMANLMPDEVRPHCDVLFEGEAEYNWPKFLKEYAEGRHADHYTQPDKIHMPDSPPPRLDILKKKYSTGIVQCTRGCPFTCEFCDIIVMYGRKMRYKPVEQVIQEVAAWQRLGATQVFFADDNFVGNRAYAKEMLRALAAWNKRQRAPMAFTTQTSIDMARDDELLGLLRDANFIQVFIGIETPRKASLHETKKLQNERIDLVEAVHKIQSYDLFISAGMIVGFDSDDPAIFDEQYEFLQAAEIPLAMLNVLTALPKTPLYHRLKAEGRLLAPDTHGAGLTEQDTTLGTTNFHPRHLTREELRQGHERLYQRLYAPEAFRARLLGNLSRFRGNTYQRMRSGGRNLPVIARLARYYMRHGRAARRFFLGCLWKAGRQSRRLLPRMLLYMGMYLHFSKVHGRSMYWDPWHPPKDEPRPAPASPVRATVA